MATTQSGYVDVNGIHMYYERHGSSGDTLVLIHGGGSTIGTSFGRILPLLARTHMVIAVELQGHGHTSQRTGPETFEQDADDVAALLHALGIHSASILGFSNGGNTAMQIAIRHPEAVRKLVLASTFYTRDGLLPGFFDGMAHATLANMPEALKSAFLAITPDSTKLESMFERDRDRMQNFCDWSDADIRSIRKPTLLMCGDRDVVRPEHAVTMSRLIEGSRLAIVPAQHGEYFGAAEVSAPTPELLAYTVRVINDFLLQ